MLIFHSTSFAVGRQQKSCSQPDILWPIVLKCLTLKEVMHCRGVCRKWKDIYIPDVIKMKYPSPEKRYLIDPRLITFTEKRDRNNPETKKNKERKPQLKLIQTIQCSLSWDEVIKKINILHDSNNLIIFIIGSTGNKIEIWDIDKKECLTKTQNIQYNNLSAIYYIHTSRLVIFKNSDCILETWQWQKNITEHHDKTVPICAPKLTQNFSSEQQQRYPSIKGKHWEAEVTSKGDSIKIRKCGKKKPTCVLKELKKQSQLPTPASLGFSPDEQWLVASYHLGSAFIWNRATGQHLKTLPPSDGEINIIAFSQDSKLIIYASDSGKILIYSII
ncbi:hypothetical protein [Endozoicomonas sp. Mp262]|uniref:F-box/WD repeat-containing protein n=1 Tax=Endozoicomonas sp. Mp262 TaxID=2919499 RepID=UPI0021D9ECFD